MSQWMARCTRVRRTCNAVLAWFLTLPWNPIVQSLNGAHWPIKNVSDSQFAHTLRCLRDDRSISPADKLVERLQAHWHNIKRRTKKKVALNLFTIFANRNILRTRIDGRRRWDENDRAKKQNPHYREIYSHSMPFGEWLLARCACASILPPLLSLSLCFSCTRPIKITIIVKPTKHVTLSPKTMVSKFDEFMSWP